MGCALQNLDFDFEKCCSVSLSPVNVYACLVCGKYFQVTRFPATLPDICAARRQTGRRSSADPPCSFGWPTVSGATFYCHPAYFPRLPGVRLAADYLQNCQSSLVWHTMQFWVLSGIAQVRKVTEMVLLMHEVPSTYLRRLVLWPANIYDDEGGATINYIPLTRWSHQCWHSAWLQDSSLQCVLKLYRCPIELDSGHHNCPLSKVQYTCL